MRPGKPDGKRIAVSPEKCYTGRRTLMDTQSQLYTSLTRYLNSLTGRNLSKHTASAYRTDLLQFLSFLTENDISVTSPEKITRTHILDYLSHLAGLGRSGVTRTRKLASIREYCKFLVNEQLLPHSPTEHIVRPKQERKQRVFLRVDEYMRLLNAAAGNSATTRSCRSSSKPVSGLLNWLGYSFRILTLMQERCLSTARATNSAPSTLRRKPP